MRRDRQSCLLRHAADLQRPGDAAHVHHIGLHHVHGAHADHRFPGGELAILLAAGDVNRQGVRNLPGLRELPVGAGLLEVPDALGFQEAAHLDRALRRVAGIGVDEFCDALAQRA